MSLRNSSNRRIFVAALTVLFTLYVGPVLAEDSPLIVCAAVMPCTDTGGVLPQFKGGACEAMYANQCESYFANECVSKLTDTEQSNQDLNRKLKTLRKANRVLRQSLRK